MRSLLRRIFGSQARQTLPDVDVFAVHDKLRFALPADCVDLFKVTHDGQTSHFCMVSLPRPRQILLDSPNRGKMLNRTEIRYIGPCGKGEFRPVVTTLEDRVVSEFLLAHYHRKPKTIAWEISDRPPETPNFKLWADIDGCFVDSLMHAKKGGHQILICHGLNGGHVVSLQRIVGSYYFYDFNFPYGTRAKSNSLPDIAQEALATTPLKSAYLFTL